MRKSFKTDFDYGDEVFVKTLPDTKCIVTGFLVRQRSVVVGVQKGDGEEWFEMCALVGVKKPVTIKGFLK